MSWERTLKHRPDFDEGRHYLWSSLIYPDPGELGARSEDDGAGDGHPELDGPGGGGEPDQATGGHGLEVTVRQAGDAHQGPTASQLQLLLI